MATVSVLVLLALTYVLLRGTSPGRVKTRKPLLVFCAAGMRYPMEEIAAAYRQEYGVDVQLQYGGSNTLLNQIEVVRTGDLYLAGDSSFIEAAIAKGLAAETLPLAWLRPVIVVPAANPKKIRGVDDLLRDDVRVALGNPDATAVGKKVRNVLRASSRWQALAKRVTDAGVFKPTVNDVANDVKLGSVDAGIVWNALLPQYPELRAVRVESFDRDPSHIECAVLSSAADPAAALHFARYVSAADKGLSVFKRLGYDTVDGDVWESRPTITFYAGAVTRRVLEPIIAEFEQREGVHVDTVYNGCGILTAQMRTIRDQQGKGFPDVYMACDVYYMQTVKDWFQEATNVSDTDIVLVVAKGNPRQITSLADLVDRDVRIAVGQPDQCTIGILTRRLLQHEGIYDKLRQAGKIVAEVPSSAMLVPAVITGSADVVLAYVSDTRSESARVDTVTISSPLAKAVQPFGIARSSRHKYLVRRLFATLARSRDKFESNGFRFRLENE